MRALDRDSARRYLAGGCISGLGSLILLVPVSDRGIGIDPDESDRIFEVFGRLLTRAVHAGTGIWQSISRRITHRHGGEIWVESAPGEGSTFYVACCWEARDERTEKERSKTGDVRSLLSIRVLPDQLDYRTRHGSRTRLQRAQ